MNTLPIIKYPRTTPTKPLAEAVRRYGLPNALRHVRNLGISFDDCYWMMFGRFPTR